MNLTFSSWSKQILLFFQDNFEAAESQSPGSLLTAEEQGEDEGEDEGVDGGEDENEDEFARPLDTSDEEEEEEDKTVEQVFKRWLVEFPSVPSTAVDSLIKYVKF